MINRRDFIALSVASPLGLKGTSADARQTGQDGNAPEHAIVNRGAPEPVEAMLDAFFGKKRNDPTPLPTMEHLDPVDVVFATFTDAHIGPPDAKRWSGIIIIYNWRVEEVIRQINSLQPDFAVHVGDSIWGAPWHPNDDWYAPAAKEALRIFSKLKCPFHNLPGTHDFGPHHDATSPSRNKELDIDEYAKFFGRVFYSFTAKQCSFIVYNGALAKINLPVAYEQDEWLKEQLSHLPKSGPSFFLSHEPLFWVSPHERGNQINVYLQPSRAELLKLLSANGVDIVYSGHTHFDFANQYENMYMHTLNSCSNNRNFLSTSGTPRPFPALAQIHDPYKFGYLIVRVSKDKVHESWVSTYWRVKSPPAELASISGPRLVARPASEADDSVLGVAATPPPSFVVSEPGEGIRGMVNDHAWRVGENVGSKWLQVWPVPSRAEGWSYLERGLTLGRPRGMKIAVPVPSNIVAMGDAWAMLEPHAKAVSAVVVCNGGPAHFPALYHTELTTWRSEGTKEEWVEGCLEARRLVPKSTKVILGRVPLREVYSRTKGRPERGSLDLSAMGGTGSGLKEFEEIARVLTGKADGVTVWISCQKQPEEFAEDINRAAQIARSCGLDLWLDAAGWEYIDESLRTAYFLRLIALCQASGVHLFWWNGPENEGGLLDGYYDPTPMYYAAQAWQALVDGPREPIKVQLGETVVLRWTDQRGREYAAWWRPSDEVRVETGWRGIGFPAGAIAADPFHGRLLRLSPGAGLPLCSWPLIWRQKERA